MPERLAKFIMEQKANPPKPVTPPKVKEPEKTKEKPEEKTAKTETATPVKEAPKPKPNEQQIAKARAQATEKVAVFQDAFAGLRDLAPDTGVGTGDRKSTRLNSSH